MDLFLGKIFLNPPSAPLFQRGERGDFCGCLAKKKDVEKWGVFFQIAKVLQPGRGGTKKDHAGTGPWGPG
jgi:hypothetical protein